MLEIIFPEAKNIESLCKLASATEKIKISATTEFITCTFSNSDKTIIYDVIIEGSKLLKFIVDIPGKILVKCIDTSSLTSCFSKCCVCRFEVLLEDGDDRFLIAFHNKYNVCKQINISEDQPDFQYNIENLYNDFSGYPDNPDLKTLNDKLAGIKTNSNTTGITHVVLDLSSNGIMDVFFYKSNEYTSAICIEDFERPYNYKYKLYINKKHNVIGKEKKIKRCSISFTKKECDLFQNISKLSPKDSLTSFYISKDEETMLISSDIGSYGRLNVFISNKKY